MKGVVLLFFFSHHIMNQGGVTQEWQEQTLLFADLDEFPLYPGCKFLGGVEKSEEAALAHLCRLFCNDKLFVSLPPSSISLSSFVQQKYTLLSRLSQLLGSQVRSQSEPSLLRALNAFCSAAHPNGSGRFAEIDTPFFSVSVYVFPAAEGNEKVVWFSFARWATDVC